MDVVAMDIDAVARNWWVILLRGIAGILFGILTFFEPGLSLAALVLLFGAYAFVDGVVLLVALVRGDILARYHKWVTALMGVLGIAVGIGTILWPGITALTLLYLVAFWAITTGILQIVAAVEFERQADNGFWVMVGGALSIVLGFLLVVFPGTGLLALVWLVGFYAELFGFSSLGIAYRLHGIDRDLNKANAPKSSGVA